MEIQFIAGLGNPEPRYNWTRHNVGFHAVERLVQSVDPKLRWETWRNGLVAQVSLGRPGGPHEPQGRREAEGARRNVWVAKPQTYMNSSGDFVQEFMRFYKLPAGAALVVYDDMDLPLGRIRMRKGGSSAGQKGLESILTRLATEDVPRLRLGIGRRPGDAEGKDYVLSRFSASERKLADQMLDRAGEALRCACEEGLEAAMNRFNADGAAGGE